MHILFNLAGAVLFGTVGFVLFSIYPSLAAHNITSVEISVFHTFFNITCTLVMFPFANVLVKLSSLIIRESEKTRQQQKSPDILIPDCWDSLL